jgi:hypothetical protein
MKAAARLAIPTDANAGPGTGVGPRGLQPWARWPRHRLEVAHEVLRRALELDRRAGAELCGTGQLWRVYCGDWVYTGPFEDAVARVALRVCEDEEHSQSLPEKRPISS